MIAGIITGTLGVLVGVACAIFWLWMLIHAITNKGLRDGEKVLWVVVVIFLPCLGPLLYFFIGRPKG
jgi:ABC-type lipoprotein release transport system permease subunit